MKAPCEPQTVNNNSVKKGRGGVAGMAQFRKHRVAETCYSHLLNLCNICEQVVNFAELLNLKEIPETRQNNCPQTEKLTNFRVKSNKKNFCHWKKNFYISKSD